MGVWTPSDLPRGSKKENCTEPPGEVDFVTNLERKKKSEKSSATAPRKAETLRPPRRLPLWRQNSKIRESPTFFISTRKDWGKSFLRDPGEGKCHDC